MFKTVSKAFKTPELRKKILFTLLLLLIFRFGSYIPVPLINTAALGSILKLGENTIFGLMDMFSGGAFSNATIFAMGISPYINASIIIQLLTVAIPALEKMQKDGENGRKKIAKIQRFSTIGLALFQGVGLYYLLKAYGIIVKSDILSAIIIVTTFVAGTAFLMWLGELITEKGVGNGISLLIFAGIVSRMPAMVGSLQCFTQGKKIAVNIISVTSLLLAIVLITMLVVLMDDAERRIPVQYAKRVVGRKIFGGQNTHIPIKLASAGVTPIIFAMSIMLFPATITQLFGFKVAQESFWGKFMRVFSPNFWPYGILYFLLIILFTYFYTSIQFNVIEMSNNMKKNGGFIPGIRPGRPTAEYIAKVLARITLVGAAFLGFIAVLPILLNNRIGIKGFSIGGTSLLILVGVSLETVRQLESQILTKSYRGFLE
jgi:preprotein translocase subunit SecY